MSRLLYVPLLLLFEVFKRFPYCSSIQLDCHKEQQFVKIDQDGLPTVNPIGVKTSAHVGFCTTECLGHTDCKSVVFLLSKSENNCLLSNAAGGSKSDERSVSYIGKFQFTKLCETAPCEHGGTCTDMCSPPFYHCACRPLYFKGQNCEVNSKCETLSPCQHGGTCSPSQQEPFYRCSCPAYFIGVNCETNTRCNYNPCNYRGHCYTQSASPLYRCSCHWPFSGYSCTSNTRCHNNPCQHGGTCHTKNDSPHYWCECTTARWGDNCEKNLLSW